MQNQIQALIEKEVQRQFKLALKTKTAESFSLEEISENIARSVIAKLPTFAEESKRDFDDPFDSFSTDVFTRWVTDWT